MKIYIIIITLSAVKNLDMMTTHVVNVAIHLNTQIQYVILIAHNILGLYFLNSVLPTPHCSSWLPVSASHCSVSSTQLNQSCPLQPLETHLPVVEQEREDILTYLIGKKIYIIRNIIRCKTIHNLFAPVYLHIQVITSLKQ